MTKYCSIETLKLIYHANIQSHLSNGIVLFGGGQVIKIIRLCWFFKKSNSHHVKFNDYVKEHFHKLGLLTIYRPSLHVLQSVILSKDNIDTIPKLGTNHNYFTRNTSRFLSSFPSHSTKLY